MTTVAAPIRFTPSVQLALLAGPLLSMVDSNVVNVAIPDISRELHGSLAAVQWTVSGYLLALAATLPATAWLAKRFGTIRVYAWSLAMFTLTSAACALAYSVPALVSARVLQGVAAAPLVPLAMNLVFGGGGTALRRVPAAAGIVLFLGPALGPTVGGLLIAAWSWPAIFLINVPVGIGALAALPALRRQGVADHRDPGARFDPVGLALLSAGLVLAVYGASRAPGDGWLSTAAWPFWSTGVLLVLAYAVWAHGRPHPAVDLRLLRVPRSALAIWLCVLASVALFGVIFLMPVLMQSVQRHGPLGTGLALLPQGLAMGLSTQLGQVLGNRGRHRLSVIAGMAALAISTAALLFITADTPLWITSMVLAGRGLALGLVIQPLLTAMLSGLGPARLADANTLFNVGQRLGGSLGVSLLVTYFESRVFGRMTGQPALDAAIAGFRDTIWVVVALSLVGLGCALLLPRVRETPTTT